MWGHPQVHDAVLPTIPTADWGGQMTPGGFKPFEHEWTLTEIFEFHQKIGKARSQARIHNLAGWLKEGLVAMDHVTFYTPLDKNLSSGIVCSDVEGFTLLQVVHALHRRGIIASGTPYSPSHIRFTPGIYNPGEEIEEVRLRRKQVDFLQRG